MKKLIIFLASIALSGGLAIAQDDPNGADTTDAETSPGARIAAYGKIGRVLIDGQQIYISKGLTDIIMEEGAADLENDPKIQCQHLRRTGSHITMRVCRTVAELREQEEYNREYFERWYRRKATSICAEGGNTRGERINNGQFPVGC